MSGQPVNIPIAQSSFELGYGASMSQDLGVTPAQLQEYQPGYTVDGIYTLTFSVENGFPSYPGYYILGLSYGTQELGEVTGWGIKTLGQVTAVFPSPGYLIIDQSLNCDQNPCTVGPPDSAQGKNNLVLTATVNGWTLLFKNASLTFTLVT